MRQKLVAANWKMNLTSEEAKQLASSYVHWIPQRQGIEVVVCPPHVFLFQVQEVLRKSHIKLGAQNVFWKERGAYTGNISPNMLLDAGVAYCIVGHSETRGRFGSLEIDGELLDYFSETDKTVHLKIQALLERFIYPILCVGETLEERKAGRTDSVIRGQLEGALCGMEFSQLHQLVVAYEPVWAIGTGESCEAKEAERVCAQIRQVLSEILDPDIANFVRILYGGSIKASNARELFQQSNIDGGLVGGASLDAREFSQIVASA
jgi:triosephosphate isomerase